MSSITFLQQLEQLHTKHSAAREKAQSEVDEYLNSNKDRWFTEVKFAMTELDHWNHHNDDIYKFSYTLINHSPWFDYSSKEFNSFIDVHRILNVINEEFKMRGDTCKFRFSMSKNCGPTLIINLHAGTRLDEEMRALVDERARKRAEEEKLAEIVRQEERELKKKQQEDKRKQREIEFYEKSKNRIYNHIEKAWNQFTNIKEWNTNAHLERISCRYWFEVPTSATDLHEIFQTEIEKRVKNKWNDSRIVSKFEKSSGSFSYELRYEPLKTTS